MLSELKRTRANRVMGIDCSTNSLAFAVLENGEPVRWGEIYFTGIDNYSRLPDARHKTEALMKEFESVDAIAFEKAIQVRSIDVAIKMGYSFGAVLSVLLESGATVNEVYPISWQSYIGNPNLTKAEKDNLRKKHPGRSASWYQNAGREIRKNRTKAWVKKKYGITVESDNVSDSFGLAYFCQEHLTSG